MSRGGRRWMTEGRKEGRCVDKREGGRMAG